MKSVVDYIKEQQEQSPAEIASQWEKIEQLYTNKLWHQLTSLLMEFVKQERFQKGTELLDLYNYFISDFENKINPLSLVEILCPYVIRQYSDSKDALQFLEKIKEKTKSSAEANILCSTAMGIIHLVGGDFAKTKKIIEESEENLDALPGVTVVHSRFYELCSNYHQRLCNHNEYYKDALRYLGCVPLDKIPSAEQQERAFNLGLAGLLGSKVFNFGELLQHPVLTTLQNTPRQWLFDLLYAFNSGDIEKMNSLKPLWSSQPDLISDELKLRQKIMLLCLMEVEEKVHMLWVQPRVLDKQQIKKMKQKLDTWCKDVHSMETLIAREAGDILT